MNMWMRIEALLVSLCVGLAWMPAARAEEEAKEFEGYSARAKAAVERMLASLARLENYSDEAVYRVVTDASFKMPDQPVRCSFSRPKRFRVRTSEQDICSDGRQLTVYLKNMQRYQVVPLEEDLGKQLGTYTRGMGLRFGAAELLLAQKPAEILAEQVQDLELVGKDDVDGTPCVKLQGTMKSSRLGFGDSEVPITLWLRESDFLLRQVELDLTDMLKRQFEDNEEGVQPRLTEYRMVYDLRNIKVNETPGKDEFVLEPPEQAKKVDKFYTGAAGGETAQQFELSGQPALELDLPTVDGRGLTLSALKNRVVVLYLAPGYDMSGSGSTLRALADVQRDYADKGVALVYVHPGSSAEKLLEAEPDAARKLVVALDAEGTAAQQYFEEQWAGGTVLINREGIVQGRYLGPLVEQTTRALRSDLDKLLAGQALPAAAAMTDEQKQEAAEQRASRGGMVSSVEPVNEAHLHEAWSVLARVGMNFGGTGQAARSVVRDGLWVRDRNNVRCISPEGKITAEIPIIEVASGRFNQEAFTVGRLGRGMGVVYLSTIPGDEEQAGWRPPKAARLVANDEEGRELWRLELPVENYQIPQGLCTGDVDGRGGDEVLFLQGGALWVVDGRGEVIVRKAVAGWPMSLLVEDRDNDRRAEMYVQTQQKLHRFDYRPQK